MGYHLRILRGTTEPEINQDEFAAAVRAIPSLILEDDGCRARFVREGSLRSTIFLSDGEAWTNTAEDDVLEVSSKLEITNLNFTVIPEPASYALILSFFSLFLVAVKRRPST